MEDRTMKKFGKLLRRSTGDLFDLQIGTYVSCSKCLMFDRAQVTTQDEGAEQRGVQLTTYTTRRVRKLHIGLYKNLTVGSFLVMFDSGGDGEKRSPQNIVWLKKGCIVTKSDGNDKDSLTLHCSEMGDVECAFDCAAKKKKWYKSIRSELNSHHNNNASHSVRNNADQIFTIQKQGCLRQCSKRSSSEQSRLAADLSQMFIGTTSF